MNATTKSGVITILNGSLRWLTLHARQNDLLRSEAPPGFLHPTEIEHWETLKVDKRRREWTLGRRAAKELITELIHEETDRQVDFAEIAIIPHADGWPIVILPGQPGAPAVTLSISHSKEMAFCAAAEGANRLLGADIEVIEPRAAAFAEEYFTPLENLFLAAVPTKQTTTLINAVWSGKEAALKAIRRGLAEDTRLVSCLPHPIMDGKAEWLPMRIEWDAGRANHPMPLLSGYWRQEGDFVMALAFAVASD